jgi:uncharacterized protein (DUF427 family)
MSQAMEDRVIDIVQHPGGKSIRFEDSPRWVRVVFAGKVIADSKRVKLMFEPGRLPVYYFPVDDVRMDLMLPSEHTTDSPHKGTASYWNVKVGDRVAENACWRYLAPPSQAMQFRDYVAFYWDRMDAWFEEDDEVFLHPRDPYHRVDVANSSRHVVVTIDGIIVAETRRPRLLFETGLPTRYYMPKMDVRMELLKPSDTMTVCPYKGRAVYWSAEVNGKLHENIVWSYPAPIPECPKIENLLSFFNERVDIEVDRQLQKRAVTQWSEVVSSYG